MLSKYIIHTWNNEIEDQVSRINSALNYTKIEYYKNDFITYSVEEDVSDLLHNEKRKREELIDYNNKLLIKKLKTNNLKLFILCQNFTTITHHMSTWLTTAKKKERKQEKLYGEYFGTC